MKSSSPNETIKNLIPVLSKKDKQDLVAYITVFEKYAKDFYSEKAMNVLKDSPVFGKLIRDIPKEVSDSRNKGSMLLQKDAIVNDNWQPYIEYQIEQGITFARMGLDFKSWSNIISFVRNYLTPYLKKEYGSGVEFLSAINGMNNFLSITNAIIGEAYMHEMGEIIQSNEIKLKQVKAIAHIGSWEIDFATNSGIWSEEACRIYGLLLEDNKQSFETWLSFIHPEDLEYVKKEIEKSNASLSDTILNHRIMRKDGTVRNIYSVYKFVLDHVGKPIGLYGICQDVTVQKLAEEEIKSLNEKLEEKVINRTTQLENTIQQLNEYKYFFNNNYDLCGIANSTGYFETINTNFVNVLGYSEKEFCGTPFIDLVHPDDVPATLQVYETLKAGAPLIYFLNRYRKKDGNYLYLDWNATPNPETQKLYCVARDITERKRTREQLQEVNKELEAFTYSVSHDLRAPLRAVNGYAQMLKEDYETKLDEEGKRIIKAIRDYALKMGTLIDDLLAFSQLGRKEVKYTKINMNELVEDVLIDLDKLFTNKAEIKIGKLPHVKADRSLLKQVMVNLISNALKYSSKKEHPIVEIFSEKKQGEIVFSVKDNGTGFDMKYYDKLFGVFQRLHKQNEFEGVGVGLAIVQRVIAKHGGKVWAEGKVDEGAIFNFSLTIN